MYEFVIKFINILKKNYCIYIGGRENLIMVYDYVLYLLTYKYDLSLRSPINNEIDEKLNMMLQIVIKIN